ncbi:hypothetical protein L2E82_25618 [Cichorium intybus]|uniref:Uncharacterized protein n=1 Tax=Cichorium intybus TaxID=13427 RepID=A0ACB9E466_CICIN|nr:hypothetical protein L2E82_25618 [Cichorium intybus]
MEGRNCLFDLPTYRVVIKLFVALNDLSRAVRYFSKLKEAWFFPGFDIYMDLIKIYAVHGMIADCKEAEVAGFKVEEQTSLKDSFNSWFLASTSTVEARSLSSGDKNVKFFHIL